MRDFKTVEEKAEEWSVSFRHIQNLCRKGKIEGAIKRVGAWFIPDDVVNPMKNTKANARNFKFVGTKKKIFYEAIELFASHGFENVSIKDIAGAVGIRQSAVYNHFKSKQEILDTIYDYYRYAYCANRPTLEEMEPVLRKGSVLDIIMAVKDVFGEEHQATLFKAAQIVFHRAFFDEKAKELVKSLTLEEGLTFVEVVFRKAIEIGRFASFDVHTVAIVVNAIRVYALLNWIVDPSNENIEEMAHDEQALYKYTVGLFPELNSPLN